MNVQFDVKLQLVKFAAKMLIVLIVDQLTNDINTTPAKTKTTKSSIGNIDFFFVYCKFFSIYFHLGKYPTRSLM
jgi:hypothetical protein